MASIEKSGIERTHLSPEEAAGMVGVHKATIYRWAKDGALPLKRARGWTFIKVSDLHAFIDGEAA